MFSHVIVLKVSLIKICNFIYTEVIKIQVLNWILCYKMLQNKTFVLAVIMASTNIFDNLQLSTGRFT